MRFIQNVFGNITAKENTDNVALVRSPLLFIPVIASHSQH